MFDTIEKANLRLKPICCSGAVSVEFWSGGCEMASDVSRKFLAPPCRGEPLIYKHINRGLTYDLLTVIYHLLKI